MGFWDSVKKGLSNAASSISRGVDNLVKKLPSSTQIAKGFEKVESKAENVIGTVYSDAKSAISFVGTSYKGTVDKVIDKGSDLIKNTENTLGNTLSSLGSSLSLPLILIGGAALVFLVGMKR